MCARLYMTLCVCVCVRVCVYVCVCVKCNYKLYIIYLFNLYDTFDFSAVFSMLS